MSVKESTELLKAWRQKLDGEITKISDTHGYDIFITDKWTLLDMIRHILWHEEEMINLFKSKDLTSSSPLWEKQLQDRNEAIWEEMRKISKKDILTRYPAAVEDLVTVISSFSDEIISNSSNFKGMDSDWDPVNILAQNSWEHYQDHLRMLERFKAKKI